MEDIAAAEAALSGAADVGNPIKRTVELRALKAGPGTEGVLASALLDIQSNVAQLRSEVQQSRGIGPPLGSPRADAVRVAAMRIFTDPRLLSRGISVHSLETGEAAIVANANIQGRPFRVEVKRPAWRSADDLAEMTNEVVENLLANAGPGPETGNVVQGPA